MEPNTIPARSASKVMAGASFATISAFQRNTPTPWYYPAPSVLKENKLDNNSGIHKFILMMTPSHQKHRQWR